MSFYFCFLFRQSFARSPFLEAQWGRAIPIWIYCILTLHVSITLYWTGAWRIMLVLCYVLLMVCAFDTGIIRQAPWLMTDGIFCVTKENPGKNWRMWPQFFVILPHNIQRKARAIGSVPNKGALPNAFVCSSTEGSCLPLLGNTGAHWCSDYEVIYYRRQKKSIWYSVRKTGQPSALPYVCDAVVILT